MSPTDLTRIMIASDSNDGMDTALAKAARLLEQQDSGQIRVVRSSYDRIAEEPAEIMPREERQTLIDALLRADREALQQLIDAQRPHGHPIDTEVLWRKQAADAIVEAAGKWPAQLLIKPASQHHGLADFLHTPLDWALSRQAPCPVLISRNSWDAGVQRILAAVDMGDPEHVSLNGEILREACRLGLLLGAEVHVATAYPDLGQAVNELQVAQDFAGIKASMRENRQQALNTLLQNLELSVHQIHLLEGKAMHVIPALARDLDAPLSVLGTAARRGVSRLLIGNTAEALMARMAGDLLTVRAPWS